MSKKIFFLLITSILFVCCNNKTTVVESQSESERTFILPEDAISIVYRGHIYIPSEVDSISGNFLFDTGADGLYFDSIFYANNPFRKLKFFNSKLPGGGTSGPQKTITITDTVSFSFKSFSNNLSFIFVLKLKPIIGDFADGILGKRYFSDKILEINYFHEYLRLHNDFSTIDTSEYVKISMKKGAYNFLYLPAIIQINDSISIQDNLLLDIGSGWSVIITSSTANKYNLSKNIADKVPYYDKYSGVSGKSSSCSFRASFVQIGGYKLDDVIMDYSEDKSGFKAGSKHSDFFGILGNKILDRFDIIIDFINNDLYLKPNQDYNKPYNFSKLGFRFVDRSITKNAWIVAGLYKGSNAEIAGLKIDDQIISVNGIDIHQIPFKEQTEFWDKLDKVVLIVLRNGEEKRIEFDLEYVL